MSNSHHLFYIAAKGAINNLVKLILLSVGLSFALVNTYADGEIADTSLSRIYYEKSESIRSVYPDSAMAFAKQSLTAAERSGSPHYISLARQALGKCYISSENYEAATENFLLALKIEEGRKDSYRIASLTDDMGYIYYILERFETSLDYYNRALKLYTELNHSSGISKVLMHIGSLHASRKFCTTRSNEEQKFDNEKAVEFFHQALQISKLINDQESINAVYINLGSVHKNLNNTDSAAWYLNKALKYYSTANNPEKLSSVYYSLGLLYTLKKDYKKAIECYRLSEAIATKYGLKEGIQYLFVEMAYTFELAGFYKESKEYYVQYMILRDSIYNSKKAEQIFELETQYQTEKREKEILKLSLEKKRRNFYVILLVVILVFTLITSRYILVRSRQKRMLAEQLSIINEQKIRELEQEKILVATQSVLTGEETERRRLARDLHDGLGGMLSGIKLKLTNMKGNFFLDEKGKADFENALVMLDNSVSELRQVAHNLMPESLIKFGLKDALGDYCSTLDNSLDIKLRFSFYGNHKRVDQAIEIAMYRIAQELINNAIKHSGCTEIVIDLIQEPVRICLTVQDNGKGFDLATTDAGKGMGLNSIKARVSVLNGIIDMTTEKEKGTEIIIEFGIK